VLLNAKALFSRIPVAELLDPTVQAQRAAVERHHLFPKAYLATLGISDIRETNQIANYALVEWGDNASISDQAPVLYLPALKERFAEAELREMYSWHALPENWERLDYHDFLEERRDLMAKVISEGHRQLIDVKETPTEVDDELSVDDMVSVGESVTVEFKCAVRTNLHTGREDELIKWSWLRTVAGFLNLSGGTLVIGVTDDGEPVGLDADGFSSDDELYSYLTDLMKTRLGENNLKNIHPRFEDYHGTRVLVIECWPSDNPVFLNDGGKDHFFVRAGATTRELSSDLIPAFIEQRSIS